MSETQAVKHLISHFCTGLGIDIGCGGDPVTSDCLRFDLKNPYIAQNEYPAQFFLETTPILTYINNNVFDYIYSSHLVEDFYYSDLINIVNDWMRALKINGKLIICAPDQQKYIKYNEDIGIPRTDHRVNQAHKEQDFSMQNFIDKILTNINVKHQIILSIPDIEPYSWILVIEKQ